MTVQAPHGSEETRPQTRDPCGMQASSKEDSLQQMQQYSKQLGSNLSGLEDRLKADRSRQATADQREHRSSSLRLCACMQTSRWESADPVYHCIGAH